MEALAAELGPIPQQWASQLCGKARAPPPAAGLEAVEDCAAAVEAMARRRALRRWRIARQQ